MHDELTGQSVEQRLRELKEQIALQNQEIEALKQTAQRVKKNTRSIVFFRNVAVVFLGAVCLVSAVDWGTEEGGSGRFSFHGDRLPKISDFSQLITTLAGAGVIGALGFRKVEDRDNDGQPD
jgi:uncharacterized small protein (DUF1192 family)